MFLFHLFSSSFLQLLVKHRHERFKSIGPLSSTPLSSLESIHDESKTNSAILRSNLSTRSVPPPVQSLVCQTEL